MSITTKESEKKIISEYVQLSNKAKTLYKSKEYHLPIYHILHYCLLFLP